jgi:hypothetical protein
MGPEILSETLPPTQFNTGDARLDELLIAAKSKFLDPDPNVRRESLEKLWDAWERLKTIEPGKDKKAKVAALLNRTATGPEFRQVLEEDANDLTRIGNNFEIRHSETSMTPINDAEQVDYFFHRMFAMVWLALDATGRTG